MASPLATGIIQRPGVGQVADAGRSRQSAPHCSQAPAAPRPCQRQAVVARLAPPVRSSDQGEKQRIARVAPVQLEEFDQSRRPRVCQAARDDATMVKQLGVAAASSRPLHYDAAVATKRNNATWRFC